MERNVDYAGRRLLEMEAGGGRNRKPKKTDRLHRRTNIKNIGAN